MLSLDRTQSFTFIDQSPLAGEAPIYPLLHVDRLSEPIKVENLTISGNRWSLFRTPPKGRPSPLPGLHASLVLAFNPRHFTLRGQDPSKHVRIDICQALVHNSQGHGWSRLEHVTFAGASLESPVSSWGFAASRASSPIRYTTTFEIQRPHHPIIWRGRGRPPRIWLDNVAWHLLQSPPCDPARPHGMFPDPALPRAVILAPDPRQRDAVERILLRRAQQCLGGPAGLDRMALITITVAPRSVAQAE